jgi:hypothetical protein
MGFVLARNRTKMRGVITRFVLKMFMFDAKRSCAELQ